MELLIGGKYRLLRPLSKGGMGEIWEAETADSVKRVAVKKILETARWRNVDNLLRFRKEAEILAGLNHPNVVRVYDYIESEDDYYIAMELVDGVNLDEYLGARGAISVELFLELSIILAETLAFIHTNGVLHGDIKPGNIMLREDGARLRIKLLDFGMSRMVAQQTSGPYAMGSFSYMSPEQSGILKKPVDFRSDLYSLGIVFYRCLAGELPYTAPSVYALIHKHIAFEAPPLHEARPDIPPIIGEIVRKLMNKDIMQRYENAALLARDLRTVKKGLGGEPELLQFVPGFSLKPRIEQSVLRLIGRNEEFAALVRHYTDASRGNGRLVILSGEAGIGKTRLMEELQEYSITEGGICLSSIFSEYESPLPYSGFFKALDKLFPLIEMYPQEKQEKIRSRMRESLGFFGGVIVQHLPRLGGFLSIKSLAYVPVKGRNSQRLIEKSIRNILESISKEFPVLLLCIENLQWSDFATRELLRKLSEEKQPGNILVLCTLRPSEPKDADMQLAESGERINLFPFTKDDVSRLIAQFVGREDPTFRPLGDMLYRKTGGNAYFIIELLQLLVRERLIWPNDKWHIDYPAIEKLPFTENVASIVSQSIELLDEATRNVLALAAVWGKEFSISEILGCFNELSAKNVFASLEAAAKMNILMQSTDHLRFSHDICFDVVYNSITPAEKAAIHERIARHLETRVEEDERIVYRIAHHYRGTPLTDKRLEYLKKVGLLSQRTASFQGALDAYREAASLCSGGPLGSDTEKQWIHLHLGETYASIGHYEKAREHLGTAFDLAPTGAEKADILRLISHALQSEGDYKAAVDALTRALALLGDRLPHKGIPLGAETMVQILLQAVHSYFSRKYVRTRVAMSDSLLLKKQKIYQEIGLVCLWGMRQDLLMYSHFKALNLCDLAGESEDGVILLLTHFAVLASLDVPPLLVRRLYRRAFRFLSRTERSLAMLGNPYLGQALYFSVKVAANLHPRSLPEARHALSLLARNGTVNLLQEVSNCAAQVFEYCGRFHELDAMADDVVGKGSLLHNTHMVSIGRLYKGIAAYYLGDAKTCLGILRPVLTELAQSRDGVNAQYARLFIFKALCRLDRLRDAVPIAETAIRIINTEHQAHPMVISRIYPFYLEELIISYSSQRDIFLLTSAIRKRIDWLYKKCRSLVRAYDAHEGTFHRLAFLYAWHIRKKPEEARRWYMRGAAFLLKSGQPYELGLLHYRYGMCLLKDDPKLSGSILEKAFLEMDKCGALFEMRRIERTLKTLAREPEEQDAQEATQTEPTPGLRSDSFSALRELDNLLDVTRKISVIKDASELAEEILRHAMELVGAEQGELFLMEGERSASMRKITAEGVPDYPTCPGVVSRVESTGTPLLIPDATKDAVLRNDPIVLRHNLRSILCVPLVSREKKIGLLYLSNQKVEGIFTAHELELLVAMAGQAAVAMENTALFMRTRTLQTYLDEILDSMPGAIIAVDSKGCITHFNDAAARQFPAISEKSIGRGIWSTCPVLAQYRGSFESVISRSCAVEHPREQIDNKLWRVSLFPVEGGGGTGAVFKLNDVTEEVKIQEHLIQAQKMDAIGTLVGGLTHDFNNILWGIQATINNLIETVLPSKETFTRQDLEEDFNTINHSIKRAMNLTSQLRTVRRRKPADAVPVDLRTAVGNVLEVCRKSFDKGILFDVRFPENSAQILADPVQMEQVVLNLAINAAHAMTIMRPAGEPQGGKLAISLDRIAFSDQELRVLPRQEPGDYWRLSVRDTGVGMSPDTLKKMYEPFFTTKDPGQGTGLGLAVVYTIVQNFKGHIEVESEQGVGTVFRLYFPELGASERAAASARAVGFPRGGRRKVLVIDDEDTIRRVFVKFLESAGWETIQARDGREGLEMFEHKRDRIAFVVLDVEMPILSGGRTMEGLQSLDPGVRILLSSGYTEDARIKEIITRGARTFLPKPFTERELLEAVERTMA